MEKSCDAESKSKGGMKNKGKKMVEEAKPAKSELPMPKMACCPKDA